MEASDFSFEVTCEAIPPFDRSSIEHVVSVPSYRKSYGIDAEHYRSYVGQDHRALFVARNDASLLGYMALSRSWNNFALVDAIALDVSARRLGIGRRFLDAALDWARERDLPGINAETQSNNITACRFYERYGFTLGGYDRHLYQAIMSDSSETALFWYLLFPSPD